MCVCVCVCMCESFTISKLSLYLYGSMVMVKPKLWSPGTYRLWTSSAVLSLSIPLSLSLSLSLPLYVYIYIYIYIYSKFTNTYARVCRFVFSVVYSTFSLSKEILIHVLQESAISVHQCS